MATRTITTLAALALLGASALPAGAQTTWFTTGQNADLMISGVDFNNTGGALQFHHPTGVASDGTRFLVCDRFNNRILIWKTLPARWDAQPDLVLGQENFTTNNPGTSKSGMNFPGNISVSSGGVVAVADTENDRILIWKTFPTSNAQEADVSLSLPAYTPTGSKMTYGWPWGVWTDGTKLIASATFGGAMLFWNTLPAKDNQAPDYTIALEQFGTIRNISTDGSTYLTVSDHNAKIPGSAENGTFFWNSFPTKTNQTFDFYREEWIKGIKHSDGKFIAAGLFSLYIWNTMPTSAAQKPDLTVQDKQYSNGDGPDVAYAGDRLYVCNYNGNNVQAYKGVPTSSSQRPDFSLSAPTIDTNTLASMNYIQNPAIATDGKTFVASSDFDRALWIWNTMPTKSGQAPDVKIALTNLMPWDNALNGGKLVLGGLQSVAIWDAIPTAGQAPSRTFNNQIGSVRFSAIRGVALDDTYFYIADQSSIYVWKGLPTTGTEEPFATIAITGASLNHLHSDGSYLCAVSQNNLQAVYVYRVSDIKASGAITPYKTLQTSALLPLNQPGSAITFNGSLAVTNNANHNLWLWKSVDDAGDASKVVIVGQTSATGTEPGIGANRVFMPHSLVASGNTLWMGERKFSSRILRYNFGTATGVNEAFSEMDLALSVAPNPVGLASERITVSFVLPKRERVQLSLYNALGREVARMLHAELEASRREASLSTANLPPGAYFLRLQTSSFSLTRIVQVTR